MSLPTRELGRSGLRVSAQGLGCMGMSMAYGAADDDESRRTLQRAFDLGVTFFDTADVYGIGANEKLVGEFVRGRRAAGDDIVLATKFGIVYDADAPGQRGANGRPEYVEEACDLSLLRLGLDHIDLYYNHRPDPKVPIEETVGAMAALVEAGKVRHLGLSEASADTVHRAAAAAPIAALQSEWSLFSRDIEAAIIPACREHGIGLVPYSPLGRGLLTGAVTSLSELEDDDFRRTQPRFQDENIAANLALVDVVKEVAAAKGVSPGQVALGWLAAQGADVVPIPGTKRVRYLEENVAAAAVELTGDELARLDGLEPVGARSHDPGWVNRDTPAR
ncbi:MAG: aldo/keto reductase [Acidimicrobiia bacterium]|nr:aldo/keto reductase [Acidimicrobiia bacterium]